MKCPDMSRGARLAAHGAISEALALHSDSELQDLVDAAAPLGSGIGGKSAMLEVGGSQVFVKRVPLTDLERLPENVGSTANLFGLPMFCHYGIGGPSFGAWRELAVHIMTTNWVLADEYHGFPLMHHWRILPDSTPLPEELADVDRVVSFWGGGAAVRDRVEGQRQSGASIALFLEFIPQNLHQWLGEQVDAGAEATDRACAMVDNDLHAGIAFMNSRGLLHFDAHFENILTDGQRLYFADYGLAISTDFALSPQESDFYDCHRTYDRAYARFYSTRWLVAALRGRDNLDARISEYANGRTPTGIPEVPSSIITGNAPLATVMAEFFRRLQHESRRTPYPRLEIARMVGDCDFPQGIIDA
ncbi:protein kinase family protein [Nocardia sp. NPDC058640]|uniref:protein kinase family protein n=1 Tax=Nocardia sp. NPDC058640 TaxID=3346571 RepID=UPI003667E575